MFSEEVFQWYHPNNLNLKFIHIIKEKPDWLLLAGVLLMLSQFSGCSSTLNTSSASASAGETSSVNSVVLVPNQNPVPASFKSVQLYANNAQNNPPVLELNSDDHLTLSFDELTDINGQFRITFTHHSKTWAPSNIPQDWYLNGIGELILGGGQVSQSRGPDYIHYEMRIPLNEIQFTSSGNYLLHVTDPESGQELFSLPFFITENEGELSSTSQTLFNSGNRFMPVHRLFSTYDVPDLVKYPEFDLSFSYVQNRFWSDSRFTDSYDFNTPGTAKFDLTQSNAFPANVGYVIKNLNSFSQNNTHIVEWDPGSNPPKVTLREDVVNFLNSDFGTSSSFRAYSPASSKRADYARVIFRLDGSDSLTPDNNIYILGDFNQWSATSESVMAFDSTTGLWKNSQLLKEGIYSYQYILLDETGHIDLTSLSDNNSPNVQEYMSYVYFNDPERKFDRLLAVETFYAR